MAELGEYKTADQELEPVRHTMLVYIRPPKLLNVFFMMQGEALDRLNVAEASKPASAISV